MAAGDAGVSEKALSHYNRSLGELAPEWIEQLHRERIPIKQLLAEFDWLSTARVFDATDSARFARLSLDLSRWCFGLPGGSPELRQIVEAWRMAGLGFVEVLIRDPGTFAYERAFALLARSTNPEMPSKLKQIPSSAFSPNLDFIAPYLAARTLLRPWTSTIVAVTIDSALIFHLRGQVLDFGIPDEDVWGANRDFNSVAWRSWNPIFSRPGEVAHALDVAFAERVNQLWGRLFDPGFGSAPFDAHLRWESILTLMTSMELSMSAFRVMNPAASLATAFSALSHLSEVLGLQQPGQCLEKERFGSLVRAIADGLPDDLSDEVVRVFSSLREACLRDVMQQIAPEVRTPSGQNVHIDGLGSMTADAYFLRWVNAMRNRSAHGYEVDRKVDRQVLAVHSLRVRNTFRMLPLVVLLGAMSAPERFLGFAH